MVSFVLRPIKVNVIRVYCEVKHAQILSVTRLFPPYVFSVFKHIVSQRPFSLFAIVIPSVEMVIYIVLDTESLVRVRNEHLLVVEIIHCDLLIRPQVHFLSHVQLDSVSHWVHYRLVHQLDLSGLCAQVHIIVPWETLREGKFLWEGMGLLSQSLGLDPVKLVQLSTIFKPNRDLSCGREG